MTLLFIVGVTSGDLKHCGVMPDSREHLNRSVNEWIIDYGHSIWSLEGMG